VRRSALERTASNPTRQDRSILSAVVRFNALPHLSQIKCPVLIVAGECDLTVPLPPKRELHRKLPGSEFALISDSGHATPVDQPEKFNEALLDFIGRN
jgi:3-oxoadipate enol-lactonase